MSIDDATERAMAESSQPVAPEELTETEVEPVRIMLCFSATTGDQPEQLEAIYDAIVEEAESRGFFFEFGMASRMPPEEVIAGSPLHQALTGMASKQPV